MNKKGILKYKAILIGRDSREVLIDVDTYDYLLPLWERYVETRKGDFVIHDPLGGDFKLSKIDRFEPAEYSKKYTRKPNYTYLCDNVIGLDHRGVNVICNEKIPAGEKCLCYQNCPEYERYKDPEFIKWFSTRWRGIVKKDWKECNSVWDLYLKFNKTA